MAAFTLGEAAAVALGRIGANGGSGRASGQARAMLRGSSEAGSFEAAFFAVPAKGETDRLLRMARAALDTGRRLKRDARIEGRRLSAAERSLAALTAGAVRVYEELLALARLNAGRVYPSYDWLARATALGRATVARGLVLLEAAGFLERRRRFRRIDADGPGPRVMQTSNAYRPTISAHVLALLPRWLRPAPVPCDACQHGAEHQTQLVAMRAGLSCRELADATLDGPIGAALAKLGAGIDRRERESHADPQSYSRFLLTAGQHHRHSI